MATIEELKALLDAATPLPWVAYSEEGPAKDGVGHLHSVCSEPSDDDEDKHRCVTTAYGGTEAEAARNAALIAAAVNALPALLDELADLRAWVARMDPTICWGVACVHEAKAFEMLASGMAERDALRAAVAAAQQLLDRLPRCGGPYRLKPVPGWPPPGREIVSGDGTCANVGTGYLINGADDSDRVCDACKPAAAEIAPRGIAATKHAPWVRELAAALARLEAL